MAAKQLVFDETARVAVLRGVSKLAKAVGESHGSTRTRGLTGLMRPREKGAAGNRQLRSVQFPRPPSPGRLSGGQPGGN